jgi:hypothetical protein
MMKSLSPGPLPPTRMHTRADLELQLHDVSVPLLIPSIPLGSVFSCLAVCGDTGF